MEMFQLYVKFYVYILFMSLCLCELLYFISVRSCKNIILINTQDIWRKTFAALRAWRVMLRNSGRMLGPDLLKCQIC